MIPPENLRALAAGRDETAVFDLMQRAADYMVLEDGCAADHAGAAEFFNDCVPGGNLAESVKLGAEAEGRLLAIADMSFGYPEADDAYIGLLLLDKAERRRGLGQRMLSVLDESARDRGAKRLLVAVLEANLPGVAFWQSAGFLPEKIFDPRADDPMQHKRIRMMRTVTPN